MNLFSLPIGGIDSWVLWVLKWAAVPVGLYAFGHAVFQRPDAFAAAEKQSKPIWLLITFFGTVFCLLFSLDATMFLWIAGLVAVLVYIVDVRPKLIEAQRGPRY